MNSGPYQQREDGRFALAVKEQEIKVAPEGQAKIHIALINKGPNEDNVDILVKGVPLDWTSIDTPVVHLAPGETKQVTLTVEPPAVPQSRVGQYPLEIRAVSESDPNHSASVRSNLTVAAYETEGRIGILLGSTQFSVSPGSSVTIPILLQNRGLEGDSFRLSVNGIPVSWISANSALSQLEPSASREVQLMIRVPRSSEATVGRTPIRIQFTSQKYPDQEAEVECILTVSAFSQFSTSLEPEILEAEQFGQVILQNEGNILDTYSLTFQSPGNLLIFEKAVQVPKPGSRPGTQPTELAFVEIPRGERLQIVAGQRAIYPFRSRLRSRPIIGPERSYPFTINVISAENRLAELSGQINEKGFIPIWFVFLTLAALGVLCLGLLIPLRNLQTTTRATQTAAFNQTQAALSGEEDSDGDGLTNTQEIGLGLDPFVADTDGDKLLDGDETKTYKTNPLVADTDQDKLPDGEEVQTYQTDPLNPDSDADLLNDGDEIARRTDPKNPDTDQDGLRDGAEVSSGTDPLQQDTDKDRLLDGQENQTCPRPLTPDSDSDGIIDGNDLDPCNPSNPSLTATAAAGLPTQVTPVPATPTTIVLPTALPSLTSPAPTSLPTTTPLPTTTTLPAVTATAAPPSLQGLMLFASNRDGNSEIYGLNLANQSLTRLTNSTAQDMQPALAPDSVQVAYVTNQDGNNEIYLGGLDRRLPLNLTNNPADDQQPTWSTDGKWIAFTTNRDGNQEIYVMRSDGSQIHNLTNNPGNDFAPSWFSTGGILGSQDWIAFTSTRDGNQEIYKVKPDGSGLVNLTHNPANDYSPAGFGGGALLAFVTDRDGNPEIYTMNDNGGSQTNLTNNPAQDLDPAVNPNGNWIAFSTDRDGNLEVYVVRVNGGSAYNLTRNPGQDLQPDW